MTKSWWLASQTWEAFKEALQCRYMFILRLGTGIYDLQQSEGLLSLFVLRNFPKGLPSRSHVEDEFISVINQITRWAVSKS